MKQNPFTLFTITTPAKRASCISKMLKQLKKQCLIALVTGLSLWTIACTADPQGLRTPQIQSVEKCDSVCGLIKNANKTQVTIVDRDVALRQLDMPTCHFQGC